MKSLDRTIIAFALGGGALLHFLAGVPLLIGVSIALFAWLLHPLFKMGYRLWFRCFGTRQTKHFFALARAARKDDVAAERFATLAALYEIDPRRGGIGEVRHYRTLIEDMNSHLARFPDPRRHLKSVYLRRCLREWSRSLGVEPTQATQQFDMAMAEAHAPEYRPPSKQVREFTARIFSKAFGSAVPGQPR